MFECCTNILERAQERWVDVASSEDRSQVMLRDPVRARVLQISDYRKQMLTSNTNNWRQGDAFTEFEREREVILKRTSLTT